MFINVLTMIGTAIKRAPHTGKTVLSEQHTTEIREASGLVNHQSIRHVTTIESINIKHPRFGHSFTLGID